MSKGPGKWQRTVLAAVDQHKAVYALDLLPTDHSRSDYVALLRAVNRLGNMNKIEIIEYLCGRPRLVVKQCGYVVSREIILRVDKVASCNLVNT